MKTIWKHCLYEWSRGGQNILLPAGAKIIHFSPMGVHDKTEISDLYIWIDVPDNTATLEKRMFQVFGTGDTVGPNCHHVATTFDGPFVWHLYEYKKQGE